MKRILLASTMLWTVATASAGAAERPIVLSPGQMDRVVAGVTDPRTLALGGATLLLIGIRQFATQQPDATTPEGMARIAGLDRAILRVASRLGGG